MRILIGADPEVFVKQDGKHVSAYNLIPGTKQHPHKVNSGAVQVDGMALEFNIDPVDKEEDFLYNIEDVLSTLKSMIPGYEVDITPVAVFDKDYMEAQPNEATILGCSVDYNAWSGMPNPTPNQKALFRTAAGHIHIGWTEDVMIDERHKSIASKLTQQLDFFNGLPSVIYDDNTQRRELYGRAGAFRPKPYGLEYRVLSNMWLSSKELMSLVYNNTIKALQAFKEGNKLALKYGDIQDIINNSDKDRAIAIMKQEGINYEV